MVQSESKYNQYQLQFEEHTMKKCIILLLLLQTIFQLQSMQFSKNDTIKGQKSAPYAQETIEIHEKLLDIYRLIPDEELRSALQIIPHTINTIRRCPQSTYAYLQEGSTTWHQIKKIFFGPHWGNIKEQHKKLHKLYLLASHSAYQEISASHSSQTQKLFGQLWSTSLTMLKQDNNFPKDLAAAQLLLIATFFLKIQQSPENTYSTLQDMETAEWFTGDSEQIQNSEHLQQRNAIIKKLKNCYGEIKEPGMLN